MPDLGSLTFINRKNSVVVDFKSVLSGASLPPADQFKFVRNILKIKTGEVIEVSQHSVSRNLIIGLATEEKYAEVLSLLEKGVSWEEKFPGVTLYGWSTAEYLTNVTIINWTNHLKFDALKKKISEYGTIVSHRFGVFKEDPTLRNGTVYFRLKIAENAPKLPAFIEIPSMGEALQVFTDKSERVCFKCTKKGHIAPFCKAKPKTVDYSQNPTQSWARIVEEGATPTPTENLAKNSKKTYAKATAAAPKNTPAQDKLVEKRDRRGSVDMFESLGSDANSQNESPPALLKGGEISSSAQRSMQGSEVNSENSAANSPPALHKGGEASSSSHQSMEKSEDKQSELSPGSDDLQQPGQPLLWKVPDNSPPALHKGGEPSSSPHQSMEKSEDDLEDTEKSSHDLIYKLAGKSPPALHKGGEDSSSAPQSMQESESLNSEEGLNADLNSESSVEPTVDSDGLLQPGQPLEWKQINSKGNKRALSVPEGTTRPSQRVKP